MPGPGPGPGERGVGGDDATSGGPGRVASPDRSDPVARLERSALEAVLQHPRSVDAEAFDALASDAFSVPAFRAVHEAIRAAGGLAALSGEAAWVEQVRDEAAAPVAGLVTELAVSPLPEDRPEAVDDYVRGVVDALVDLGLTRQIADARGRLQRMDPVVEADTYGEAFAELVALEGRRRALRAAD